MNDRTNAMILLLMERLIDWRTKASEDKTVSFYDVYADMLHTLNTANNILTCDSIAIICRTIQEEPRI